MSAASIKLPPLATGYLVLGAIVAAAAVWLLAGGAKTVARAAGSLPGEVAGGVVEGLGDSLGVPRTSESACDAAIREGRMLDASFACPASRFIGSLFSSRVTPAPVPNPTQAPVDTSGVDVTGAAGSWFN